ncbi:helix-turn-helix domain-containing protein [Coralloluteibacterium thermophilus]|uniref:Helix-turn-helix domain-containing protein n=1 Tax=Coralloluteibacterium thermophilum TaxID=2707049 RepID=A0ABV9NQD7_9GAMM
MSSFPERLRAARLALGMTQEELGFELGVTKASVSAWETGREAPSFRLLPGLREALACSLDALICGIEAEGVREGNADARYASRARDAGERALLQRYRTLPARQQAALLTLVKDARSERD